MKGALRFLGAAFLVLLVNLRAEAQVSSVQFGKNRVQYHNDFAEWSQYESRNFITYWYGEARIIGQASVLLAEADFGSIEKLLDHRINEKIEIVVYTDITDVKQSNIGSGEVFFNEAGQTKIVGNKIFVYFEGNHQRLRKQIREGIASVYINSMLFGSNLQEVVQNAVMMNLPIWFKDGLVAFVGEDWSTEADNQLRNLLLSGEYETFEDLAKDYPRLAGQSLWYFVGQQFGRSTVSNLIYLTRINRSVESGFLYVLGSSFSKTTETWMNYFTQRYKAEANNTQAPDGTLLPVKNKRALPITQAKLSPDGQYLAYATNEIGRVKLYLYHLPTGKRERIWREGSRNPLQATDYNYPLLAWNPNNLELAVMYERRDILKLLVFNTQTRDREIVDMAPQYQRVYSMDYINPSDLVVSAAVRGVSDIFVYFTRTRQTQRITNDLWDDLDPRAVALENRRGIVFASNRPDTSLAPQKLDTLPPAGNFDLFYFPLDQGATELVRLTNTPFANEREPIAIDTTHFGFLSDHSGIYNRYSGFLETYLHHYDQIVLLKDGSELQLHPDTLATAVLDSSEMLQVDSIFLRPVYKKRGVTFPVENYSSSVERQSSAPRARVLVEMIPLDRGYAFRSQPIDSSLFRPTVITATIYRQKQWDQRQRETKKTETPSQKEEIEKPIVPAPPPPPADTTKVDIDNYLFQSEFDEKEIPPIVVVEEDGKAISLEKPQELPQDIPLLKPEPVKPVFEQSRIIPYRVKFKTDFVTTQLDNAPLFDGLNSFAGTPSDFGFQPAGLLFKANFKDLLEDYQLEGGIRFPTTFNGAEYFLFLDNNKKRLDKRFAVYRRNLRFTGEGTLSSPIQPRTENNTFLTQVQLRYPLDVFTSIRTLGTYRVDNTVTLATDTTTLQRPTLRENRLGIRLEYVFDNTLDVSLNIKNGTRYKFYAEAIKRFDVELADRFAVDFNNGFMGILGLDFRHYERFLKHSVLAVRVAGATSFGSEKILYYLGGVDNWLFPRFDETIPFPTEGDFAFQTVAANLRGFRLNIRNGNSFALANTEIRVPIFRYLVKNPRSNFLRNFQVAGFVDVGTAWQGKTPFTDENPLNTSFIPDPILPNTPIFVKVRYFRDPIVIGYGAGVRFLLFGYFLRLDYAWGVETREVQPPRLYLALGTDF